jgi:phosphatidylglycerol lysyltransferase
MFPVIALLHASALEGMGLPQATSIAFGAGALALAVAYAALGWWVQRLELFGFVLKVPGPITTFAQIGLSLADLALAGAVFFMCLPGPAAASYPHVLAVFVVALTAGIISHVPGGLGVFETIILVGLRTKCPATRSLRRFSSSALCTFSSRWSPRAPCSAVLKQFRPGAVSHAFRKTLPVG